MEVPLDFRCPISMEMMEDPVTVCTGVTYERKNIERWLLVHKKKTCPATMQNLQSFGLTPNHTLKRLINSWQKSSPNPDSVSSSSPLLSAKHIVEILTTIQSTPFKVSPLKQLRSILEVDENSKSVFVKSGGIEILGNIIFQILIENIDSFITFRACEEALAVLFLIPLPDEALSRFLSNPECVKSMAVMIQRGSAEARLHAVSILRNIAKIECDWNLIINDQDMDIFKSLLELLSDGFCVKASSAALEVLMEIMAASRKNRLKAIEAGTICVLIELLPDSNRSKCEKMMCLIKLLCECAEGRAAFADHALGIAVISKKMLRVSHLATKLAVKILWLVCSFFPNERILEEMLVFGAVTKLSGLLQLNGNSSTKEKAINIMKLHGNSWRNTACFPSGSMDCIRILHHRS